MKDFNPLLHNPNSKDETLVELNGYAIRTLLDVPFLPRWNTILSQEIIFFNQFEFDIKS